MTMKWDNYFYETLNYILNNSKKIRKTEGIYHG